jgi:hypothetical protein
MSTDTALEVLPLLLVLLAAAPVITTVHEAGHALLAGPAGYRLTSFGVGHGRPLFAHRTRRGVVLYLGRRIWLGGVCVAIPVKVVPHRQRLYLAGGLLAQMLLAVVLGFASQTWELLEVAAHFNLLVLAFNAVPWKFGGHSSDGWGLLAASIGAGRTGELIGQRERLQRIAAFEQNVGSAVGAAWCALMDGWIDVVTGQPSRAVSAIEAGVPRLEPDLESLHAYVGAERHRQEGAPLAGLRLIQSLRSAYGADLPDEAGDLVTIAEARLYLALEEPRRAEQLLAQVAGVSGLVGQDALSVRLEALLMRGTADQVESAARRLATRLPGRFLDAPQAVLALWEAAERLEEDGRVQAAEHLRRRARRKAASLVAIASTPDRLCLVHRLGEPAGVRRVEDVADSRL